MDILYKLCDGEITITCKDGTTPVEDASVTATMRDYTGTVIPEVDNVTFTEGDPGVYTFDVQDTFNPPNGVCRLDVKVDKGGTISHGYKFIEAKELVIP